ncbi:MAG: terpene utilization protein AtuA, partial [Microbacteriaceae bacterium]|nr:terpene utilization protein AtuA [Burkholderiaceae bacterium]
ETLYGPHAAPPTLREVTMRVAVRHPKKEALELFAREKSAPGTSWSPGSTGPGGGRPGVSPLIVPCAFLVPRDAVQPVVRLGELAIAVPFDAPPLAATPVLLPDPAAWAMPAGATRSVPLVALAWGRSGDKGDLSNIGLIARRPEWLPLLWAQVTPEAVKAWFAHLVKGRVERFHLPGLQAMNLVLHQALEGGGPASLRLDPLGKGMAQMLLELPIEVPADWPV